MSITPEFNILEELFLPKMGNFKLFPITGHVTSFSLLEKDSDSSGMRSSRQVGEESLSKAVSKNITRILEDLLKDYDNTERPSFKDGNRETV